MLKDMKVKYPLVFMSSHFLIVLVLTILQSVIDLGPERFFPS